MLTIFIFLPPSLLIILRAHEVVMEYPSKLALKEFGIFFSLLSLALLSTDFASDTDTTPNSEFFISESPSSIK